jgi:hypothetical protein
MRLFTSLLVLCVFCTFSAAQLPPPPLEEMSKLNFLVGEWEGKGTMSFGPNHKEEAIVVEKVQSRLGGAVLLIEGLGKSTGPEQRTVHNAMAVISYDTDAKEFRMRAWRMDGRYVDPTLQVQENGFIWSFEVPQAGMMRYTMKINEKGQWHEIGEMSRDGGKNWMKFFEMTLDRTSAGAK